MPNIPVSKISTFRLPPNWETNSQNSSRNFSLGNTCNRNNAIANYNGTSSSTTRWRSMPSKFGVSDGSSLFSMNRLAFSRINESSGTASCNKACVDAEVAEMGGRRHINPGQGYPIKNMDSSQRTQIRRIKAVGDSSIPRTTNNQLSFTDVSRDISDPNNLKNLTVGNVIRSAQRRTRSGGSVAPRKKGATNANTN